MADIVLYAGLEVGNSERGRYLKIGDRRFYLENGNLEIYNGMKEMELLKQLTLRHSEIGIFMREEGIGITAVKNALERACEEERKMKPKT